MEPTVVQSYSLDDGMIPIGDHARLVEGGAVGRLVHINSNDDDVYLMIVLPIEYELDQLKDFGQAIQKVDGEQVSVVAEGQKAIRLRFKKRRHSPIISREEFEKLKEDYA